MFDAARSYVETDHPERAREMVDRLAEFAVGHQNREEIEAGLAALRSHALHLFDESEAAAEVTTGEPTGERADAVEVTAGAVTADAETPPPARPTIEPDPSESCESRPAAGESRSAATGEPKPAAAGEARSTTTDEAATDEATMDALGCGNCGEDGCGNCGTGRELKPPASGPVLAAVGAAVVFVGLSVAYTAFRAQRALRSALGDGS